MRISFSRRNVVIALALVVLLAAVPGALERLIQTGDLYLFTPRFFHDLLARLSGPGRLRFVLQPAAAILLGVRDGRKDARAGAKPFLWALAFHGAARKVLLRHAFQSTCEIISIAVLLDLISQFLIFREIHPAAALVVGPVLIGLPYAVSRALANRFWGRRSSRTSAAN